MVIEACRAVLTERCRLMCKQRGRQQRRERANIRANKPVPGRRTPSHAVAQEPRDGHLDGTKCDGAGQSDTSSDTVKLPTDQKVGDSSSSERAE
jgi:hypothetical protein